MYCCRGQLDRCEFYDWFLVSFTIYLFILRIISLYITNARYLSKLNSTVIWEEMDYGFQNTTVCFPRMMLARLCIAQLHLSWQASAKHITEWMVHPKQRHCKSRMLWHGLCFEKEGIEAAFKFYLPLPLLPATLSFSFDHRQSGGPLLTASVVESIQRNVGKIDALSIEAAKWRSPKE